MTSTTLPTRNAAWGLHGTIDHLESTSADDVAEASGIAFAAIARATLAGSASSGISASSLARWRSRASTRPLGAPG